MTIGDCFVSTGVFDRRRGRRETKDGRGDGTAACRRRLLEDGPLARRRHGVRARPQRPQRPATRSAVLGRRRTDVAATNDRETGSRQRKRRDGVSRRQRLGLS